MMTIFLMHWLTSRILFGKESEREQRRGVRISFIVPKPTCEIMPWFFLAKIVGIFTRWNENILYYRYEKKNRVSEYYWLFLAWQTQHNVCCVERDDYYFTDALEERESERKRSLKENQLRTGYLDHNRRKITGYIIVLTTQNPQDAESIRNYGFGKKLSKAYAGTYYLI